MLTRAMLVLTGALGLSGCWLLAREDAGAHAQKDG